MSLVLGGTASLSTFTVCNSSSDSSLPPSLDTTRRRTLCDRSKSRSSVDFLKWRKPGSHGTGLDLLMIGVDNSYAKSKQKNGVFRDEAKAALHNIVGQQYLDWKQSLRVGTAHAQVKGFVCKLMLCTMSTQPQASLDCRHEGIIATTPDIVKPAKDQSISAEPLSSCCKWLGKLSAR